MLYLKLAQVGSSPFEGVHTKKNTNVLDLI